MPDAISEQAALRKARESLAAAAELSVNYPDFAVSRAYYAMFYAVTAMLYRKDLRFNRHSAIIAAFGSEFSKDDPSWRRHHRNLIRAESLRNEGDYDLYAQTTPEELEETLQAATEFIEAVTDYLS